MIAVTSFCLKPSILEKTIITKKKLHKYTTGKEKQEGRTHVEDYLTNSFEITFTTFSKEIRPPLQQFFTFLISYEKPFLAYFSTFLVSEVNILILFYLWFLPIRLIRLRAFKTANLLISSISKIFRFINGMKYGCQLPCSSCN